MEVIEKIYHYVKAKVTKYKIAKAIIKTSEVGTPYVVCNQCNPLLGLQRQPLNFTPKLTCSHMPIFRLTEFVPHRHDD